MENQGGITVRRALELPGLRGGLPEVLTGEEQLDRPVRWVHAGEAPNLPALLKGGELLLTTGLGIGARPADQRAFVRKLAERGIAALVVELGPRFPQLPAALVDTARAAGLPLVQLHREVPFVTVTEQVHTELVNSHYALLRQAEEVDRRCTRALLDGGGVPGCCAPSPSSPPNRSSWRPPTGASCTRRPRPATTGRTRSTSGKGCGPAVPPTGTGLRRARWWWTYREGRRRRGRPARSVPGSSFCR